MHHHSKNDSEEITEAHRRTVNLMKLINSSDLPFKLYLHLAAVSTGFYLLANVLNATFASLKAANSYGSLVKKGDSQLLINWRPLSLINSSAKLFTRLAGGHMNKVLPKLSNPYQN